MATCEYCGEPFIAKRKDAKYCCDKHRVYGRRKRLKAEQEAKRNQMTLEGRMMLDKLTAVLPVTADKVESFIQANGVECTEAAIKLVLTAYHESQRVKA